MECKFCGANIEDDSIFCPECGKVFNEDEQSSEEAYAETEEVAANSFADTDNSINDDSIEDIENIEEYDEYDADDTADLEAVDGIDSSEAFIDAGELKKAGKIPFGFKLVSIILVVAILLCGGYFAYSWLAGDSDDGLPLVYSVKENDLYNILVYKQGMKEPISLTPSSKSLFSLNSNFVLNNERIYYISNDSTLFMLAFNENEAVKIADNVEHSSLVISASGNELLYATTAANGTGFDLYLYNGKYSEKISTIKSIAVSSVCVNYGFSRSSDNSIWYIDMQKTNTSGEELTPEAEADLLNGTLYVKKGNAAPTEILSGVSKIKYYDIEGETLVYTTSKPLDPETYSSEKLYLKEGSSVPVLLVENFFSQQVVAINKPEKGIVYLSDSVQGTDEEGNYNFTSTYKLMFKPFGGESRVIDEGLTYFYNAERLISALYDSYDYSSSKDVSDTLLYIKSGKIYVTNNLQVPGEEDTIDFAAEYPPIFSKKMDKVVYVSAEQTLYYRPINNGEVGNAVQIAENVFSFEMNKSGSEIIYASAADPANPTVSTVYSYNTKNGKSTEIAQNAYPLVYFSEGEKSIYFIDNFNAESQTVTLKEYKNGKSKIVMENITNYLAGDTGTPYIFIATTEDMSQMSLYTVDGSGKPILIDEKVSNISAY